MNPFSNRNSGYDPDQPGSYRPGGYPPPYHRYQRHRGYYRRRPPFGYRRGFSPVPWVLFFLLIVLLVGPRFFFCLPLLIILPFIFVGLSRIGRGWRPDYWWNNRNNYRQQPPPYYDRNQWQEPPQGYYPPQPPRPESPPGEWPAVDGDQGTDKKSKWD